MNENHPAAILAKNVRRLRTLRGWTQEVAAERCALAPDTIRRIERVRFSASMDTLRKLAAGFEVSACGLVAPPQAQLSRSPGFARTGYRSRSVPQTNPQFTNPRFQQQKR